MQPPGSPCWSLRTGSRRREVRARFEKGKGLGYAFLLWPADRVWPPEVNFAEGTYNGPETGATLHHKDPDHQRIQRMLEVGAHDPNGPVADWGGETVPGGVPNPETPDDVKVYVDYVRHWER